MYATNDAALTEGIGSNYDISSHVITGITVTRHYL